MNIFTQITDAILSPWRRTAFGLTLSQKTTKLKQIQQGNLGDFTMEVINRLLTVSVDCIVLTCIPRDECCQVVFCYLPSKYYCRAYSSVGNRWSEGQVNNKREGKKLKHCSSFPTDCCCPVGSATQRVCGVIYMPSLKVLSIHTLDTFIQEAASDSH